MRVSFSPAGIFLGCCYYKSQLNKDCNINHGRMEGREEINNNEASDALKEQLNSILTAVQQQAVKTEEFMQELGATASHLSNKVDYLRQEGLSSPGPGPAYE